MEVLKRSSGLVGHEAIGDEASQQIDGRMEGRAMVGLLDQTEVIQFVDDGFHEQSLS